MHRPVRAEYCFAIPRCGRPLWSEYVKCLSCAPLGVHWPANPARPCRCMGGGPSARRSCVDHARAALLCASVLLDA